MSLIFDFETRSPCNLIDRGVYIYAEHPDTDVLLASFKMSMPAPVAAVAWIQNGGPTDQICRWRRGEPCPPYLRAYVEAGGEICAHNAQFERLLWWNVMVPKYGWPKPKLEQFRCTAVTAAAMSLPRSLDRLGDALGLKTKKDKKGSELIKIHSVPRGFDLDGRPIWHPLADDPESLNAFHDYCDVDVLSEEEAHTRLIPLSDEEMEVYWLNERINDRGLRIDTISAYAAITLAEKTKDKINKELFELTDGAVPAFTLTARIKEWIHKQGVPVTVLDKEAVEELLHLTLPPKVRRVLELRIDAGKSSVDKLAAMLKATCRDGTVKGVFLHHGAGQTGRFSARLVQLHNMPRPRKIFEDAHPRLDVLFDAIRTGDPDYVQELYGKELGRPLHLLADSVRSFIWAKPNHTFIGGDFSSIEGRIAAWYGREDWKIKAFEALDRGEGAGLYETTAAGIYNIPVQGVSKQQRQVGKVADLACVAEDTLVLTHNGAKVITEVTTDDLLWDGVEWVSHQGLVDRGIRVTINVCGIKATPDHLFLVETKWQKASHIVSSRNTLCQALVTGSKNLPSWVLSECAMGRATKTESGFNVLAVPNRTWSRITTFAMEKVHGVINALKNQRGFGAKIIGVMLRYALTMNIAADCLTACQPVKTGVTTQKIVVTQITEDVELKFVTCGSKIKPRFSNTLWGLKGGTNLSLRWIVLMLIAGMNRTTLGLFQRLKTVLTNALSKLCKEESLSLRNVYDIAHAGPRNRFTIITPSGFLISHNCGFGGGVGALSRMAKTFRLDLSTVYPNLWEVADDDRRWKAVARYEENVKRQDATAIELGREAYIAGNLIVQGWREKHAGIAQAWRSLINAAMEAVHAPGTVVPAHGIPHAAYLVKHGFLWLRLPSGRCLAYGAPEIREVEVPWADKTVEPAKREKQPAVTVRGVGANNAWMRYPLNLSITYNNLVQGTARDLLVHAMHNVERAGYPVVLHAHDELVAEVHKDFGSVEEIERLMCDMPPWAAGLPMAAAGFRLKRYAKA